MNKIYAIIAILFAFAAPSAMAKNDYSCDKKFIFFPGGPEGGPFGSFVYIGAVAAENAPLPSNKPISPNALEGRNRFRKNSIASQGEWF